MVKVKLTDCIGPAYYEMFHHVEQRTYMNYLLNGGRGSLKGSFAYITTILDLTRDAENGIMTHAVGLRKVKETIRDSIFANLQWAISKLGLNNVWDSTTNPMEIFHIKNGNKILFRGCANKKDYEKIKSLKFEDGYCKIAIFEELTEFAGIDEVDSIIQSLFRGGDEAICFMMYNPPASKSNWTNEYCRKIKLLQCEGLQLDTFVHQSTYLQAPKEWLGIPFIKKAEETKRINPKKYRHMYLGEETGEGLEIYPAYNQTTNEGLLEFRPITDKEISTFTYVCRGVDFGYSHATCYIECFYDRAKQIIYIFNEVYKYKCQNFLLASFIKPLSKQHLIIADSEEPRTINELTLLGLNIVGAKKGKDSKAHGIKWVQDRVRIIVDKKRCPNIAEDLETYEFLKDKEGKIIYDYPEEPDGSAALRYSLEKFITNNEWTTF